MAVTPLGNNSAKHPTMNMTWKRAFKIERIARLSLDPVGYSNEQIANMLKCNKQTVVLVRQLPEYHAKVIEIQTGITSDWDKNLRTETETMREEVKAMMPSAMMTIRNALFSKNEGIKLKAALEIMDREGTLAKVSKTSVAVITTPNMAVDPLVSANIMALMSGAPVTSAGVTSAGAGGFTLSAQDAGIQQGAMADSNTEQTLEALDALDALDIETETKN